ncbi:MAG TPA: tRNA (N(6)-L-threonylcarbamoyladenosine(37)-C(2))-methylthiotransferase [archaeon]|nr:tRNA (N(6)-L-threonylcarbamoyladenosine(37)-C(2))-methylthiotransferase [archaeon]
MKKILLDRQNLKDSARQKNPQKIFLETYGCSANQAESEAMAGLLAKENFQIVKNENEADTILLNTCYVKHVTEQKILHRLRKLNGSKKIIVAGCMAQPGKEKILKASPNASLLSTHNIDKVVEIAQKTFSGGRVEFLEKSELEKPLLPKIRFNPIVNIVQILDGCNSRCTFCATKLAKGNTKSFSQGAIVKDVKNSLKQGCREVWLTSQDNAVYGSDRSAFSLPELLKNVCSIQGNFRVRNGMANPDGILKILPQLIKAYKSEKIYKFLHLPIQSGNDRVLARMNRHYTVSQFQKIVSAFRKEFPQITIWTDIIVGFPEETEKQFEDTLKVLEKIKFDYVNISAYGHRGGTAAAKMKKVPTEIVKDRTRAATELCDRISAEKNKAWIRWSGEILVSEKGKSAGQFIGRNFAYRPVLIEIEKNLLGEFVDAKISGVENKHLVGKVSHIGNRDF